MRSLRLVALLAIPAQMVLGQQTPSTQAGSLTLDEAIATAQRNNPGFLQIKNNVRNADAQVRTAFGALLPSASGNFRTNYQQGGTQYVQGVALPGQSDSYNGGYSVGINYNINAALAYGSRYAKANRTASEADVTNQAEVLRALVTNQYIVALQVEAQAALQDSLLQTAQGQLDLANAKMKVGAGTILEVRTAEVAVGQSQVNSLTQHNQAQIEKLKLFQQMGVPADMSGKLTTPFTVSQPTFTLDSLLGLAQRVNPDLAAKKSRDAAAQTNVKLQKTQYLPSLQLSTGYAAQSFGYANSDILASSAVAQAAASRRNCLTTDSLRVGAGLSSVPCGPGTLTAQELDAVRASNKPFSFQKAPYSLSAFVSIPIFNNFTREANLEQAKVTRDNALNDLRARSLQLTTDVTQGYLNLVTAAKTVELQTMIAGKATEELAFAEESYKVGAKTFLDVTTARGTYEQALIARVNSIYEYHKAFAALENAVGRPLR
ncbi:MAG TPA: TolC family protein, partial [Gemmatimonadaceae bacterium]|nr:TolC family protein [Gemmatimonadaceae bacterium]